MADEPQQAVQEPPQFLDAQGNPMAAPPGELHGEDYLKTLDPTMAARVKGIAEGRQPWPSQMIRSGPMGMFNQMLTTAVTQYDPEVDATKNSARAALRKQLSSTGPSTGGGNIIALNTAAAHLALLSQQADALHNFGGILSPLNAPVNAVESTFGDPRYGTFQATADNMLSPELVRVWRGAGGSEEDIKQWRARLSTSKSPAELHAVLADVAHGIEGRLDALEAQRDQVLGPSGKDIQVATPQTRAIFQMVKAKAGEASSAAPPAVNPFR